MKTYYLYIVLTRTNTVISKIIQVIKKDEFTHAAISLDKDLNHMYSFGRRKTYNPFVGRFKKEEMNEGIYKTSNTLPGAVIEVQVSKQQYEKTKELIEHFINNSNTYKYNYMGLVYCLLNRTSYRDDKFLCSEFVYYILNESDIADLKIPRNLVRPQSLLNIEGKVIYNGNLKELKPAANVNMNKQEIKVRRLSEIYE
jgi:ribosomal protein L31E